MATLRTRIDRLEGKQGTNALGPSVIFLCGVGGLDRATGEATGVETAAAWVKAGAIHDYLIRERSETEETFKARAEALTKL
jgi:hypothetical protein